MEKLNGMIMVATNAIEFNLSIGEAVQAMENDGALVCRKGWNGKNMFLFYVPGSTFMVNRKPLLGIYKEGTIINYQPHIDMKTADDTVVPWLCSQSDLLGKDFGIIGFTPKSNQ